ncbi:hypothetical protein BDA99DRAFT_531228 [Phascolomyces articulosus]|uniref:Uncharacterized protein n=1 Tax=Phascolomyces articulosus TaxID=60185 RepID=A0AAD5PJ90_9FUNG|nr:hypothetical protein BDA99DRAFT_531228 [Phascolomyces articulosus]
MLFDYHDSHSPFFSLYVITIINVRTCKRCIDPLATMGFAAVGFFLHIWRLIAHSEQFRTTPSTIPRDIWEYATLQSFTDDGDCSNRYHKKMLFDSFGIQHHFLRRIELGENECSESSA